MVVALDHTRAPYAGLHPSRAKDAALGRHVRHQARRADGFTLIELSIVILIIGLVLGGIVIGRDLIAAAQLRSILAQLEQYDAAVLAFKAKYGRLPGDCPTAVDFGLGDAGCGGIEIAARA